MSEAEMHAQSQFLTCRIEDEEYGVGLLETREILEYQTLTRVPNAPPFIRGVINLRGNVVPVVDLAVKFGRPPRPLHQRTCIVIVETGTPEEGRTVVGLVADAVNQVIELAPDQIEPAPSFGSHARDAHLRGLGRSRDRFVLLLALDRVLADVAPAAAYVAPDPAAEAGPEGVPAVPA